MFPSMSVNVSMNMTMGIAPTMVHGYDPQQVSIIPCSFYFNELNTLMIDQRDSFYHTVHGTLKQF